MSIQGVLSASFITICQAVHEVSANWQAHSHSGKDNIVCLLVEGNAHLKFLQAKDDGLLLDLEPKQMWVLHLSLRCARAVSYRDTAHRPCLSMANSLHHPANMLIYSEPVTEKRDGLRWKRRDHGLFVFSHWLLEIFYFFSNPRLLRPQKCLHLMKAGQPSPRSPDASEH